MNKCVFLIDYQSLGCYRGKPQRAIATLEGTDPILDAPYNSRQDAIAKCAAIARGKGFDVFALQDGGWCASSANAGATYDTYGESNDCKDDGEGGLWSNEVYRFAIN